MMIMSFIMIVNVITYDNKHVANYDNNHHDCHHDGQNHNLDSAENDDDHRHSDDDDYDGDDADDDDDVDGDFHHTIACIILQNGQNSHNSIAMMIDRSLYRSN